MARISETYNLGSIEDLEELIRQLQEMYTQLAVAINQKPDVYQRNVNGVPTDGNSSDIFLSQGDININTTTNKVEMLTNHTATTVVWTTLS